MRTIIVSPIARPKPRIMLRQCRAKPQEKPLARPLILASMPKMPPDKPRNRSQGIFGDRINDGNDE
jgi:hypothetical protein